MRLVVIGCIASLLCVSASAEDKCGSYNLAMANKLHGVDHSGLSEFETCQVGITQDSSGNVELLNFKKCPPAVRARVAQHIMSKAPFPPSPDPSCIAGEQTWSFGK